MLRNIAAALLVLLLLLQPTGTTHAAVTASGDVTPDEILTTTFGYISSDVYIGQSGAGLASVTDGSEAYSRRLYLGDEPGAAGALSISGHKSAWFNQDWIEIGSQGIGLVDVTDGGKLSGTYAFLGREVGSQGYVRVEGADSLLYAFQLFGGIDGSATLDIADGGVVQSDWVQIAFNEGSTGYFRIDGPGSKLELIERGRGVGVGGRGVGILTVTNGGTLIGGGSMGAAPGASGLVRINGIGSTWTADGVTVGRGGVGTLSISNGGAVRSDDTVKIGSDAGSIGHATIDGPGSEWNSSGYSTEIGSSGDGTLAITNGGSLTSGRAVIGREQGSTGRVVVDGVGSSWSTTHSILVGLDGNGSLEVTGGAILNSGVGVGSTSGQAELAITGGGSVNSNSGAVGSLATSRGEVVVHGDGSVWNSTSSLTLGAAGHAQLVVQQGGRVDTGNVDSSRNVGSTAQILITDADSELRVSEEFYLGRRNDLPSGTTVMAITNQGLVRVGGKLSIHGVLDHEIRIASGGMLALAGEADASLGDFLSLVNRPEAIRYWDDDAQRLVDVASAIVGDYSLQYQSTGDLAGYTFLTVHAAGPSGDFDHDVDVDGGDFLAWQRGYSPGSGDSPNLADWQTNFGAGAPVAANLATTPEPASLALVLLGLTAARLAQRASRPRGR